MEMEKSHKLYQIVRLRQMVMKWRVQAIQRARLMKARSRKLITYNHPSLSSSLSSPHASPLSSSSRKNKDRKEGEGEGGGGGGGEEGKEVEVEEEEEEDEKIEGLPPKGFVAVYVGESECRHEELRRFLVQIECLCHPAFQKLLHKAEDEFGFAHHHGGIVIPCNVALFQRMLALLQQQQQQQRQRQPNKSTKRHIHSHHHTTNTTSTSTTSGKSSSNIDDDVGTSVELEKLVELCLGDQPKPQPQTCGGNGPSQPIASLHDLIH